MIANRYNNPFFVLNIIILGFFSLVGLLLGSPGMLLPAVSQAQEQEVDFDAETYQALDRLGEVFEIVRREYVEEMSDTELVEATIRGMLRELDPHSAYFTEKILKRFQEENSGQFAGLGIHISPKDDLIVVVAPIDGTPAQRAGITSGDIIAQVDGVSLSGLTIQEAVNLMRGEIGTEVTLTILREDEEPFNVTIVREQITTSPIQWTRFGNVGYVRITSFTEQANNYLVKALENLWQGKTNSLDLSLPAAEPDDDVVSGSLIGLVLDLRNNPGGLLNQAVAVTDTFLETGEIVSTRGRENRAAQRYQAETGDLLQGLPLIILINQGSASASEIVAAALQNHQRALVMGTMSFGKGTVQNTFPLRSTNAGAIKLTIQKYYTPSGSSIQGAGVTPDIVVEQVANPEAIIAESQQFNESSLPRSIEGEDPVQDVELQAEILKLDYQLHRAVEMVIGLDRIRQAS